MSTLRTLGGVVVSEPSAIRGFRNFVVELEVESLPAFSREANVLSIHSHVEPKLLDERQNMIVAGNVTGNLPNAGDYFTLLNTWGFTQAQFNSSNLIVDVTDDGADINPASGLGVNAYSTGPVAANHFVLYESGNRPIGAATPTGTSRYVAKGRFGTAGTDAGLGNNGHGQLNMSIVGGFVPTGTVGGVNFAAAPHADASGYRYGLGVAPFVRMANSVIFDPNYTNPNFSTMLNANFAGGTRISSNSWGAPVAGAYNVDSQTYDALVRDAQAGVALNQQMTILFAAGNSGSGASTVGSPGTAKNVITVGASENVHPFGGADGCGSTDADANSLNDMVGFSSRGPTTDARVKPDIVAPGTHVTGMAFVTPTSTGTGTEVASFRADGVCGGVGSNWFPSTQRWYTASSGTSHSTPALAGGAALVYQQFLNNPSYLATQRTPASGAPSPALVKAYLMNTTRYMNGAGAGGNLPSNSQGMGLMDLGRSFDTTPRLIRDQAAADRFTASGQSRSFRGTISDNTRPVRLTLAWTDVPGSTTGNSYVNNLDLQVLHGGNLYRGNVFTGANSSTGGSLDVRNNVESVFLPSGISGPVSIIVTATNIAGQADPTVAGVNQDFALVGYNLQASSTCPAITSVETTRLAEGSIGVPYSQQLTGTGSTAPYTIALVSGTLPPGLTLTGNTISGMPSSNGSFTFSLSLSDANGCIGINTYVIGIGTPNLALGTQTITTGNGLMEPSECNNLNVVLSNTGTTVARNIVATLSSSATGVSVVQAQASYPDIPPGGSATNLTPFRVSTTGALVCSSSNAFSLSASYTGGTLPAANFNLFAGNTSYQFSSGVGTVAATAPANLVASSQQDDAVVNVTVPAGFNFSLYGVNVTGGTVLRAGTNGFLLFAASGTTDGATSAFSNTALPTTNLIDTVRALTPFWDDLDLATASSTTNAGIYSVLSGIAPNRTWQLVWRGERYEATNTNTTETLRFAIEFSENSNNFRFIYDLTGAGVANGGSATVGVQQSSTGLFTQHSFNQAVITPGLALTGSAGCNAGTGACAASSTSIVSTTPSGNQTVGVPYSVNVSVTGSSPTGSVSVSDGQGGNCSFTLPASACSITSLVAGNLTLTANYAGNSTHPASSDTEPVTVVANNRGLQVGSVSIPATIAGANSMTRVNFARAFNGPPVVIVMPSNEDADPQALRVRNVTTTGFDLLQIEAAGCAGCTALGGSMTVHWLAAIPGSYRLANELAMPFGFGSEQRGTGAGVLMKVGTASLSASQYNPGAGFASWPAASFDEINFPSSPGFNFAAPPVLLTALQSWSQGNEGSDLDATVQPAVLTGTPEPWSTVAVRNLSVTGFEAAMEHSEVDLDDTGVLGPQQAETLGYVAMESGVSVNLVTDSGSPVSLATGQSTVNSTCVNTDLPMPGVITPANLRGFASLQSRNEADGGWLRRCTLADAGGGNARAGIKVQEDQEFDLETTHGNESIGLVIFGSDFTTTPVSLAYMSATVAGQQLDVRFESATEVGHLGYRVWGRQSADEAWALIDGALILAEDSTDKLTRSGYQRLLSANGVREVRIEDIDILGRSRFHAPIKVGESRGSSVVTPSLDWSAIRSANAQAVRAVANGTTLLADVRRDGVQRIRFEDMTALGFQASGVLAEQIAVLDEGSGVPRHVSCPGVAFGPGCSVEWWGKARESLYGSVNVYAITVDLAQARVVGGGAASSGTSTAGVFRDTLKQSPNRLYSFTSPGVDPWYDARIVATQAPAEVTRSFALADRAPGPVRLAVDVWGGVDFPGDTADHSVAVLVNGIEVASRRFDGLSAQRIEAELDPASLLASNTLTVRVRGDTGFAADVIMLDGYQVSYPRLTRAAGGRLDYQGEVSEGAVSLFTNGFETPTRFALQGVTGPSVVWSQLDSVVLRDEINSDVLLNSRVSRLSLVPMTAVERPLLRATAPQLPEPALTDYLIVAPTLFVDELQPLRLLQAARGLQVQVMTTEAIFAKHSDHAPDPNAIAAEIALRKPRFVLLVGGDSVDYHDYLGLGSQSLIPTFYRVNDEIVRFAPTDTPFADTDRDGNPDVAIGRIPARTIVELQRAIRSIEQRATAPAERFLAVSGGSDGSASFATHSRSLLSYLRQGQTRDYASVDEQGVIVARNQAAQGLAGGADWLSYLGHSSPNRWGFENVLDTQQLAAITRVGAPAVVTQWGCWNNYFVAVNQDTMAHALMLRSNSLAAAVIGSASLAEDSSHMALGTRFFDLVEDGRIGEQSGVPINTLGEALNAAKRDLWLSSPEHRAAVNSMILFGDPAQPLR